MLCTSKNIICYKADGLRIIDIARILNQYLTFLHSVAIPKKPHSLMTLNVTSRSLTLTWVEPHENNAPISGYKVCFWQPDFLGGGNDTFIVPGAVEQVLIGVLHPGVSYTFTVVAFNGIGDSVPSAPLSIRTLDEGSYWPLH